MLPGPVAVAASLVHTARDGTLGLGVLTSLRRLLIGYGLSAAVGIALGMLIGRLALLRATLGPMVVGLQALPSICWLPLALLWFGLSEKAILFVVVMGSVLAITIATEGAVRAVPPLYVRAARTMGARRLRLYARVILPASLPGITTGLKLGWTFAWRSLMAGELLYVAGGLGQLLTLGRELNDMARVMAVMVVIVVLGLAFERLLFGALERRVRERWGYDTPS
ncbi:MAG TPA: ABC transporter permease [Polyangia bacterium]|jgi:NitT/TauT family transport system permease protein